MQPASLGAEHTGGMQGGLQGIKHFFQAFWAVWMQAIVFRKNTVSHSRQVSFEVVVSMSGEKAGAPKTISMQK